MTAAGDTLADFRRHLRLIDDSVERLGAQIEAGHVSYPFEGEELSPSFAEAAGHLGASEVIYLRVATDPRRMSSSRLFTAYAAAEAVRRLAPTYTQNALGRVEYELVRSGAMPIAEYRSGVSATTPPHERLLELVRRPDADLCSRKLADLLPGVPAKLAAADKDLRRVARMKARGDFLLESVAKQTSIWRWQAVDREYFILSAKQPRPAELAVLWVEAYVAASVQPKLLALVQEQISAEIELRCPGFTTTAVQPGAEDDLMLRRIDAYCAARGVRPVEVALAQPPQPAPMTARVSSVLTTAARALRPQRQPGPRPRP